MRLTRPHALAVVTTGALVVAALVTPPASALEPRRPPATQLPATQLPATQPTTGSLLDPRVRRTADPDATSPTALPTRGPVQVMLELDDAPSSVAYAGALRGGRRAAAGAGRAQRSRVLAGQREVLQALGRNGTRASTLYTTSSVYAGVAVSTDASRLRALGALPGVKAVHLLTPKRMANADTVPLTGAPNVWASSSTGEGIRIGIIDSGVDYTHADFGGPGTAEAYTAARAASTRPPIYPAGGNVVGGVDLSGDDYDPTAMLPDGSPDRRRTRPKPDANPLDCEGHGSHVAGTAAGLGVTTVGQTFRGPYTGLRSDAFRIGPGVAPGAAIYAIKVFGCQGSTDLVTQALDWAGDPNRDGDVSDHLDVVNLSLGGDFSSPQDPDSVAADNLARLGTVVVAAAGNAGDVQDAVGAPGAATRAIAVAASDDAVAVVDGLIVDAPQGLEPSPSLDGTSDNVFGAEQSAGDSAGGVPPYDWVAKGGVRATSLVRVGRWAAPVGPGNNADGCDRYSPADAAAVAGKVAFLRWTDVGDRRCGSGTRGATAVAAGAVGVVLGDDVNSFSAGIAGDPRLPMMLVIKQGTDALSRAVDASGNDGSVKVSLTQDHRASVRVSLAGSTLDPTDRVGVFSSRGFGTAQAVKPDVTAPGVTVFSADVGTGAGGVSDSGTSMASPHVAGVAALVRKAHPSWTVEQVKAAIMITAGARVMPETGGPLTEGPARAGSGRVQADRAVTTGALVYGADGSGGVSLSFGDVAVTRAAVLSRRLRVQNVSSAAHTYALTYRPTVSTPGVSFTVSPSHVTVAPHAAATVLVTLRLNPAAMRRTLDPTMSTDAGLRSYYSDASGSVAVRGDGSLVKVPVYVAPRPASSMSSAATASVAASGDGTLDLVGKHLSQGSGGTTDPRIYASTVTALMLQGTSPRRPDCSRTVVTGCTAFADDRAGDLRYVGVASDVPYVRAPFDGSKGADNGYAYVGVSSWGPWRTPASYAEFDVYLDTDAGSPKGTPQPELVLFNSRLAPDSDIMVATLVDLRTGAVVDQEPLNAAVGSLDTGLFHSDSMVLPLWLPALLPYLPKRSNGTVASTRLGYWVQGGTVESGVTDAIGSQARPLGLDLRSPALRAAGNSMGPALNDDASGAAYRLRVHRDLTRLGPDRPQGLLLIHHQNLNGARAQVVRVGGSTTTRLTTTVTAYTRGGRPTFTASVRPTFGSALPSGTVTFRDGTKIIGRTALVRGTTAVRPSAMPSGRHVLTATYDGDRLWAPSTSVRVGLSIAGRPTSTSIAVPATVSFGQVATAASRVLPVEATGYVTFREGGRALTRAPVERGRANTQLPLLSPGRHVLRATYDGSSAYAASTSGTVSITVAVAVR